jgi:disulfide bond formation protein DsbB
VTAPAEPRQGPRLRLVPGRQIGLAAGAGSLALLAAAYLFEYVGGLAPCPLCLWQRWPHALAALLGVAALVAPLRPVAVIGAAAMVISAALGLYHVGIEQAWWAGPATCAAPDIAGLTPDQLFDRIMAAPVVRCEEIAWQMFGISMAGWNALASLGLAGIWAAAYASSSASQYR